MDSGHFGTWWGVGKFKQKERLFFRTWVILPRVFERLRAFLSISLSYLLWVGAFYLQDSHLCGWEPLDFGMNILFTEPLHALDPTILLDNFVA